MDLCAYATVFDVFAANDFPVVHKGRASETQVLLTERSARYDKWARLFEHLPFVTFKRMKTISRTSPINIHCFSAVYTYT